MNSGTNNILIGCKDHPNMIKNKSYISNTHGFVQYVYCEGCEQEETNKEILKLRIKELENEILVMDI